MLPTATSRGKSAQFAGQVDKRVSIVNRHELALLSYPALKCCTVDCVESTVAHYSLAGRN